VLEGARQREYGDSRDGDADDDTEALDAGAAARRFLQHGDFQGAYPFRATAATRAPPIRGD